MGTPGTVSTGAGGMTVAVSAIVGAVPTCGPDFAHPNVCCKAGGCVERPNGPFAPCDDGWLTFLDRRCCPLDGLMSCIDVPAVDGGTGLGPGVCALPCGPEGHSPSGTNFAACSNTTSQLPCVYCCSGSGCASNVCHCPVAGPGSPPCACNTPSCGACPDGWRAPAAQVDLCCRAGTGGNAECFSQSVAVSFVEGFSSSSGPSDCDVFKATGGHVFEISCVGTKTPACTCNSGRRHDGTDGERLATFRVAGSNPDGLTHARTEIRATSPVWFPRRCRRIAAPFSVAVRRCS